MRFVVEKELPKNVQTLSLSYELFDVTNFAASVNEGHGVAGHE